MNDTCSIVLGRVCDTCPPFTPRQPVRQDQRSRQAGGRVGSVVVLTADYPSRDQGSAWGLGECGLWQKKIKHAGPKADLTHPLKQLPNEPSLPGSPTEPDVSNTATTDLQWLAVLMVKGGWEAEAHTQLMLNFASSYLSGSAPLSLARAELPLWPHSVAKTGEEKSCSVNPVRWVHVYVSKLSGRLLPRRTSSNKLFFSGLPPPLNSSSLS